jgi:predicted amidohydrolase
MESLADASRRASAYVVMGINERDRAYRGRMYNSILYLGPEGELLGTHRKICNTISERLFHTPGDGGDNLKTVFNTEIGNLGGSICGEHNQLLLTYYWTMQGLEVHCSLWPGHRTLTGISDICTRALCVNAHVFAVSAATYMRDEDRPQNFYQNSAFNDPGWFRGGSGIINPFGEYIAGPVYDEETIIYGDIDLAETDGSLMGTNLAGIYSRWDLMNINVREQVYEPALSMESSVSGPADLNRNLVEFLTSRVEQLEEQLNALISDVPEND